MTRRLRALLRFSPLVPPLFLAACATATGCDPARAGFLESMDCANGGFQGRQAYLEQNLVGARANALEQQADAARANASAKAAQRDLGARRRELSRLDGRLGELRGRLAAAANRPGVNQAQVRAATAELNDLEHAQNSVSHENPAQSELRQIEARQQKINRILNDL